MTAFSAHLAMGLVPAEPMLVLGQMTTTDPTRSPAGTESVWCYTHVPQRTKGDAGGDGITGRWDDRDAQLFADRVEAHVERFAPGFGELVLARTVQTPRTMPQDDRCLHSGAVNYGTPGLHRNSSCVPFRGSGDRRRRSSRLPGVSIGTSGRRVHGPPGANAARAAVTGAVQASARLRPPPRLPG